MKLGWHLILRVRLEKGKGGIVVFHTIAITSSGSTWPRLLSHIPPPSIPMAVPLSHPTLDLSLMPPLEMPFWWGQLQRDNQKILFCNSIGLSWFPPDCLSQIHLQHQFILSWTISQWQLFFFFEDNWASWGTWAIQGIEMKNFWWYWLRTNH